LRCGHQWKSNCDHVKDGAHTIIQPKLFPPRRCARCRSPLWNTPRKNKQSAKERKEQIQQLELDRDGWQKLYDSEKRRRIELEAEVAHLNEIIKGNNQVIEAQFNDLCSAQLTIKSLRKRTSST
jgi:hypothetical protein